MPTPVTLVSCSDSEVLLWQLPTPQGKVGFTLQHDLGKTSTLGWSRSSQIMAVGSKVHGSIGLFTPAGAHIDSLTTSNLSASKPSAVSALTFAAQSLTICSGSDDRTLKVWDCKKREVSKVLHGHRSEISCCSFNDKDELIASGSRVGDVVVHSVSSSSTPHWIRTGQGAGDAILAAQFSPFRKGILAAAGEESCVQLWDTGKGDVVVSNFKHHKSTVTGLVFSPVNELLLCSAGLDRHLYFYDVQANKLVKSIVCDAPVTALDFMNDGFTVSAGTETGKVFVYDLRSLGAGGTPAMAVEAHSSPVLSVRFQLTPPKSSAKTRQKTAGKENAKPADSNAPPQHAVQARMTHESSSFTPPSAEASTPLLEHGRNSFEPSSSIFNHGFSPIASVNTSSATDLDRVQAKKAEEENMKKRYAMSTSPVGLQDAPMDTPKVQNRNSMDLTANFSKRPPDELSTPQRLSLPTRTPTDMLRNANRPEQPNFDLRSSPHVANVRSRTSVDPTDLPPPPPANRKAANEEDQTRPLGAQHSSPAASGGAELSGRTLRGAPEMNAEMSPYLQASMEQTMSAMKEAIQEDVKNMHLDMIRQFHWQQMETQRMLQDFINENRELKEEVRMLRKELYQLRSGY